MLSLLWTDEAVEDLENIADYIAARNPDAAVRIKSLIEQTAERLPERPHLYRSGRVPGTREVVVHPNYLLVYRVLADGIEVTAVLHARQNYP